MAALNVPFAADGRSAAQSPGITNIFRIERKVGY